jgi:hypothetical protein
MAAKIVRKAAEAHSNLDGVGRNTLSRSQEPHHAKLRTPAMSSKAAWS